MSTPRDATQGIRGRGSFKGARFTTTNIRGGRGRDSRSPNPPFNTNNAAQSNTTAANGHGSSGRGRGRGRGTPDKIGRGTSTFNPGAGDGSRTRGGFRGGQASAPLAQKEIETWRLPENADAPDYKQKMEKKFRELQERRLQEVEQAIAEGKMSAEGAQMDLKNAIAKVGTCEDMCPEYERAERIFQNMVHSCEMIYLPNGKRVPCEERMVMSYKKSAAGRGEVPPSGLLSVDATKRALDYLMNDLIGGEAGFTPAIHAFIWDRTREMRKDLRLQGVSKPEAIRTIIECFELIVRFHVLSLHHWSNPALTESYPDFSPDQEFEQLRNSVVELSHLYHDHKDVVQSPHEAEFRAYEIIMAVRHEKTNIESAMQYWRADIVNDRRVQLAREIYAAAGSIIDLLGPARLGSSTRGSIACPPAVARGNSLDFWSLIKQRKTPFLMGCMAETVFVHPRRAALLTLQKVYNRPKVGAQEDLIISDVTRMLGFDTEDEAIKFCEEHQFEVGERADGNAFLKLHNRPLNVYSKWKMFFSKKLVDYKRRGRMPLALIRSLTFSEAVAQGLVNHQAPVAAEQKPVTTPFGGFGSQQMTSSEVAPKPSGSASNPFSNPGAPPGPFSKLAQVQTSDSSTRPASGSLAVLAPGNPFAQPAGGNLQPVITNTDIAKHVFNTPSTSPFTQPNKWTAPGQSAIDAGTQASNHFAPNPFGSLSAGAKAPQGGNNTTLNAFGSPLAGKAPQTSKPTSSDAFGLFSAAAAPITSDITPLNPFGLPSTPTSTAPAPQAPNTTSSNPFGFPLTTAIPQASEIKSANPFNLPPTKTTTAPASQAANTIPSNPFGLPSTSSAPQHMFATPVDAPEAPAASFQSPSHSKVASLSPVKALSSVNTRKTSSDSGQPLFFPDNSSNLASPKSPSAYTSLPPKTSSQAILPSPSSKLATASSTPVFNIVPPANTATSKKPLFSAFPGSTPAQPTTASVGPPSSFSQPVVGRNGVTMPAGAPLKPPGMSTPREPPRSDKSLEILGSGATAFPIPSSIPPTIDTPARQTAPSGPSRKELFAKLTNALLAGPEGIMQQFLEHEIGNTVRNAMRKVEREREKKKIVEARIFLLALKFGRRWRNLAWKAKLHRKAKVRRAGLAQTLRELKSRSQSHSRTTSASPAPQLEPFASLIGPSSNSTMLPPPKPAEKSSKRVSLPANSKLQDLQSKRDLNGSKTEERNPRVSTAKLDQSSRKRMHSDFSSSSAMKRSRAATANLAGEMLIDQERLMRQAASRLVLGRTDTTRSDYFKLKSLGLDPDTPFVPQTTTRKRLLIDESESFTRKSRVSPAKMPAGMASPLISMRTARPKIELKSGEQEQPSRHSKLASEDDDDHLFAQLDAMKKQMAEDTAWFREVRAQSERDSVERARETEKQRKVREWKPSVSRTEARWQRNGLPNFLRAPWTPRETVSRSTSQVSDAQEAQVPTKSVPKPTSKMRQHVGAEENYKVEEESEEEIDSGTRYRAGEQEYEEEEEDEEDDEEEEEEYDEEDYEYNGIDTQAFGSAKVDSAFAAKGASAEDAIEL